MQLVMHWLTSALVIALMPQLQRLKEQGAEVRLYRGHVLQKKEGSKWVDVPLVAAA